MRHIDSFFEIRGSLTNDSLSELIQALHFVPNGFGHQFNDPGAVCKDRLIGDFDLIYVIGGQNSITIGQEKYDCKPGDAILIPPFIRHSIETPAFNLHNNYWIHFDVFPLYRQADFISAMCSNSGYKLEIGITEELRSLYRSLEKEANCKDPGYMAMFNAIFVQIIVLLLRNKGSNYAGSAKISDKYPNEMKIVDKSVEYVYKNLYNPVRIVDMCEHLHVSKPYLFKAFMKVLKLPPNQFILLTKIKKAEQLIKSTDMTFKEISEALAFSSPYYFSSVFKKFYQMSPREYAEL